MLYARGLGIAKNVAYPLNPSSSQATGSHPGKAKSYEPRPWMKQCCLWGERKVLLFYILSTGHRQFPPSLQPKRKNGNVKKKDPHWEQKSKQRKKIRCKFKRKETS